jgi:Mn2+/Fe2+ NRAMP family transporter
VALPGLPLIPLIYSSQVVNAVVLPLHIVGLLLLAGNAEIMGEARSSSISRTMGWMSLALVLACLGGMAWSWIG